VRAILLDSSAQQGEERGRTREEERVDVLAVVAERHLLLAEADRVLARGDAIEALEVGLVNAAQREVQVDRVCARGWGRRWRRVSSRAAAGGREGWEEDARMPTFCGRVAGLGAKGWKREDDMVR